MVFTVATVLDVICTIAFFFTKKSCKLCTKNKSNNIHGKQFYISFYRNIKSHNEPILASAFHTRDFHTNGTRAHNPPL